MTKPIKRNYRNLLIKSRLFSLFHTKTSYSKFVKIFIISILILNSFLIKGLSFSNCEFIKCLHFENLPPDSLPDNQGLYNGRVWRNLYFTIEGNQFLFSRDFLPGSVTMNGRKFTDVLLKYDIFSDEILVPTNSGKTLQLNKELLDSFSIQYQNEKYDFIRIDNLEGLNGYFNVIYNGKSKLYVRYLKKIDRPTIEGKRDNFYQINRIFFVIDNKPHEIKSKKDLLKLMENEKSKIKAYIKTNKIEVLKDTPESLCPIVSYYDKITQ